MNKILTNGSNVLRLDQSSITKSFDVTYTGHHLVGKTVALPADMQSYLSAGWQGIFSNGPHDYALPLNQEATFSLASASWITIHCKLTPTELIIYEDSAVTSDASGTYSNFYLKVNPYILIDCPQQTWNPRMPGGQYEGVGWYVDDVNATLNFVDSIPIYIYIHPYAGTATELYFNTWTPNSSITLTTEDSSFSMTGQYDEDLDEYVFDVSGIPGIGLGTEFGAYVTPILRTQAFITNNSIIRTHPGSTTTAVYTLTPYQLTSYDGTHPLGSVGLDMVHHFDSADTSTTLLTDSNNVLGSEYNANILKGTNQVDSRFFYSISGSGVEILGGFTGASWNDFIFSVGEVLHHYTPDPNANYKLQCIYSNVVIA